MDELIRSFEFFLLLVVLIEVLFLRGRILKHSLNISLLSFLIFISFRSEDYNSDTRNYFFWFDFVKQSSFAEAFIQKLEPLHIFYINFAPNVLVWLLLENISILLISFLISRKISAGLYSILISFELTLISSSFRYVLGLLFLVCIDLYFYRLKYIKFYSLFSGFVHTSAFVGLFFRKISYYLIALIPVAIYIFYVFLVNFLDRIDVEAEISFAGFRVLIVFGIIFTLTRLSVNHFSWMRLDLNRYFLLMILLFIVANTFFPMANRWMYIALFIFLLEIEFGYPRFFNIVIGRISYVASAFLIILPMLAYNYSIIYGNLDPA